MSSLLVNIQSTSSCLLLWTLPGASSCSLSHIYKKNLYRIIEQSCRQFLYLTYTTLSHVSSEEGKKKQLYTEQGQKDHAECCLGMGERSGRGG